MVRFKRVAKISEIHFQLRFCRHESECDIQLFPVLLQEIHRYFLFPVLVFFNYIYFSSSGLYANKYKTYRRGEN